MQFRDLKLQYKAMESNINKAISNVIEDSNFISGYQVSELEDELNSYAGTKHCITCANGTDALTLSLMAWEIGKGDAIFVPDFTFFASGEVVSFTGATPIFIDVENDTFNLSVSSLEEAIKKVLDDGRLIPKAIIAVDLFGQPANYGEIRRIANQYNLYILEDAAQGFGGAIGDKRACSFGDISTTSFFPAKPLGCYGDGGAVFTDNDEWAKLIRSYSIHGKGTDKYDNIRIGMNSRLDTIQAAILKVKLEAFQKYELEAVNHAASIYTKLLSSIVQTPKILDSYLSSWAQYTICLNDVKQRDGLQNYLKSLNIPSMIYYPIPMHKQKAFKNKITQIVNLKNTEDLCNTVLSLPIHPYLKESEIEEVCKAIEGYINN